jgi:hypothetical protein
LGVEGVGPGGVVGDDVFFVAALPVDAVGGDEGGEAGGFDFAVVAGMAGKGFEAFFGVDVGVCVEEGGEVGAVGRLMGEDDVVFAGAVDFEEAEFGEGPFVAVAAFGVAGDFAGMTAVAFAFVGGINAAVVGAVEGAVFDDGGVVADEGGLG